MEWLEKVIIQILRVKNDLELKKKDIMEVLLHQKVAFLQFFKIKVLGFISTL